MTTDTGIFWISVAVLLSVGLLLGQFAAVAVGAMAAVILAHQRMTRGADVDLAASSARPAA